MQAAELDVLCGRTMRIHPQSGLSIVNLPGLFKFRFLTICHRIVVSLVVAGLSHYNKRNLIVDPSKLKNPAWLCWTPDLKNLTGQGFVLSLRPFFCD